MLLIGSIFTSGATFLRGSPGFPARVGWTYVGSLPSCLHPGQSAWRRVEERKSSDLTSAGPGAAAVLWQNLSTSLPERRASGSTTESCLASNRLLKSRLASGMSLVQDTRLRYPEYLPKVLKFGWSGAAATRARHLPPTRNAFALAQAGALQCSTL